MNYCLTFNQYNEIPTVFITYFRPQVVTTIIGAGYADWKFQYRDGTGSHLIAENLVHPLAIADILPRIAVPTLTEELHFFFSDKPLEYSIRYWPESYRGRRELYYQNYYLQKNENIIVIPKNLTGLIFQLEAKWPQGLTKYEFYLKRYVADLNFT
jgi:hypothetical protein